MRSIHLSGINRVLLFSSSIFTILPYTFHQSKKKNTMNPFFKLMLQLVFDILLTLLAIFIICGVLIALQFPIVMSSPITALGFAVLITVSLGSVSAKVGTTLAPLPIFALILVSIEHLFILSINFNQPQHL